MADFSKHKARKRFGQNFLHDQTIIERIISAIQPKPDQTLIEIGPGQGALTLPLIHAATHIHAIEIDRDLIAALKATFRHSQLTLHNADALHFDFTDFQAAQQNTLNAIRVVGNLPYNISTPLLFHLLTHKAVIQDMHFMLQKEVVDRMAATPGSKTYGRLSVMLQYHCDVEALFKVPPTAFNPQPAVDSAIVRLTPLSTPRVAVNNELQFAQLTTTVFKQRRKTLRNNLKGLLSEAQISALDIDPSLRPEQLSITQLALLANALPVNARK